MKFQTVGWEHIEMNVPEDWKMIFEKEKYKSKAGKTGYFGFSDTIQRRLELSYAKIEKKAPEITDVLKDYYKSLKKTYKKIEIRKEANSKINDHLAKYIFWKKENIEGYIYSWICSKTKRLLICTSQYSKDEKSSLKQVIMDVISQINCHPNKEFSIWTAPNLQIHTPYLKMQLNSRDLLIGLTFLEFENKNITLFSYRIGLADQKIKSEEEIVDWFKTNYRKYLPRIPSKYNPEVFTKLVFKKKVNIWKNVESKKSIFHLKNVYFETYLWLNIEKNDIYCLIFSLKKQPSAKIRELIDNMTKLAIANN